MIFAEHTFRLGRRHEDGATERQHLEAAERQIANLPMWRGARRVVPDQPPFPWPLHYMWRWFHEHSLGLAVSGMAPPVVTWEGLAAWSAFMRIDLEPWEAVTLVKLGCLRASILSEQAKANAGQNEN